MAPGLAVWMQERRANCGDPVKTDPDEACCCARRPARGHGAVTALQPGSLTGTPGFLPAALLTRQDLVAAGLFETAFAVFLKMSHGMRERT